MELNKAILISKKELTYDVVELRFRPADPEVFLANFRAGKFVSVKIPGEKITFRSYSISGIYETGDFELCVKVVEEGVGSNFLKGLNEEAEIEFLGPNGHFTFNSPAEKKIILVATGTGIAPMKAFLEEQLIKLNNRQEFELIFGLRYIKDIFYKEFLDSLASKYKNFKYTIAISRPEDKPWNKSTDFTDKIVSDKVATGRVTDALRAKDVDSNSTELYICGLKEMVEEVNQIATEKGINETSVHFERFN